VIALAIIILLIGLVALIVLAVAMRVIVASINLMTIVGSLVATIASVILMMATLMAMILPVAGFMALRDGKTVHLLPFWLLLVLGNLLKNSGRFIGSLTLLKKGNELKQVRGHHFVCLLELKMMHLGLRKEDSSLFSCTLGNSIVQQM
jgi:hypothetical protein